jgi:hypothetical protein
VFQHVPEPHTQILQQKIVSFVQQNVVLVLDLLSRNVKVVLQEIICSELNAEVLVQTDFMRIV